jgi:hypothetical protein
MMAGCVVIPPLPFVLTEPSEVVGEPAYIVIARKIEPKNGGGPSEVVISIDDNNVSRLGSGEYTVIPITPGRRVIEAKWHQLSPPYLLGGPQAAIVIFWFENKPSRLLIDCVPGQIKYIVPEMWDKIVLFPVDKLDGDYSLEKLTYVPAGK